MNGPAVNSGHYEACAEWPHIVLVLEDPSKYRYSPDIGTDEVLSCIHFRSTLFSG